MMAKVVGFIRRRHDFDFDAFSRHWRSVHRAHALRLDRWLKGYVQAHLLPGPFAGMQRPADGCPLLWIGDPDDMTALAASEEFRTGAYLDEPLFMEGRSSGLLVDEEVLLPPPPVAAVKLMLFVGLKADAPELPAEPLWPARRATGHVRDHARRRAGDDPVYAFDLVEELWWDDAAAFAADLAAMPTLASSPWIDTVRSKAALVEEVVVIPRRR